MSLPSQADFVAFLALKNQGRGRGVAESEASFRTETGKQGLRGVVRGLFGTGKVVPNDDAEVTEQQDQRGTDIKQNELHKSPKSLSHLRLRSLVTGSRAHSHLARHFTYRFMGMGNDDSGGLQNRKCFGQLAAEVMAVARLHRVVRGRIRTGPCSSRAPLPLAVCGKRPISGLHQVTVFAVDPHSQDDSLALGRGRISRLAGEEPAMRSTRPTDPDAPFLGRVEHHPLQSKGKGIRVTNPI